MKTRNRGFTLLEIMVAVAVFAVAGAAVIKNASLTINQTTSVRDKTIAHWIAQNELGQLRSTPRDPANFARAGTDRHQVTMADRQWEVVVDVQATDNENMRRVEVSVYREQDLENPLALLTGFLGRY